MFSGDGKKIGAPAENYAYNLYYTRYVQGVSSFVNTDWGLTDNDSSIPWSYECICFTVNNNGIVSIEWHNPTNALETVQESSAMKPFDEIIGIFETMVKTEYEAYVDQWTDGRGEMDIDISAIQLGLVRARTRAQRKQRDGAYGARMGVLREQQNDLRRWSSQL